MGRLSLLTHCNKDCPVPRPRFLSSSLHWPQCVPPALGAWLCCLHPTWNLRGEEGQPANNRGRQKSSGGWGLQPQGPTWTLVRGAHRSLGNTRKENSQPALVKDTLPAISSLDLPPWEMKGLKEIRSHLVSTLQFLYKQPQGARAISERKCTANSKGDSNV